MIDTYAAPWETDQSSLRPFFVLAKFVLTFNDKNRTKLARTKNGQKELNSVSQCAAYVKHFWAHAIILNFHDPKPVCQIIWDNKFLVSIVRLTVGVCCVDQPSR